MNLHRHLLAALRAMLVLTLLLGLAYPLAITAAGRLAADRADGSLVRQDGRVVGSSLLGQQFTGPEWFAGRPSAVDDPGAESGGSNLAMTDARQLKAVEERRRALLAANPGASPSIPADALTASGSGLDPHISPAYAHWQVARVARARHLDATRVDELVTRQTTGRTLGVLGEPRVNVLELNLALLQLAGR